MHYYLTLTSTCNLKCKYCYGKTVEDFVSLDKLEKYDLTLPPEINYDIKELNRLSKNDDNFKITFYGGEPLLRIDLIKKIMDEVEAKEFMIQTNGIFLDKLQKEYINRLSTILVSIDGTPEHTNERRGKGVFQTVIKNLKLIKNEYGFNGEIIARMTVDETGNIFRDITFLNENPFFKFNSIHWQIDAMFWENDYKTRNFNEWVDSNYLPNLKKLVYWWFDKIRNEKKIVRIYPFVGIVYSLLTNEKVISRCGAGHSVLGIQTDGKIVACPITSGYKPLYMGDVRISTLKDLEKNRIEPEEPCLSCEIFNVCGGRCLYANKTKLWGEKGYKEVCKTTFELVNYLKEILPEIKKMIDDKTLNVEDFNYPRYNGTEIIP